MADVQIQQNPDRGGTSWIWAVVILILVAIIAWFVVGGTGGAREGAEVEVTVPAGGGDAGGAGTGGATGGSKTP